MIKITVRSYGRADSILKKTLGGLVQQKDLNLGRQLVLAVPKSQYDAYCEALSNFPLLDVIIAEPGGYNATNALIDYFPEGEQVIFMDDDISNVKLYKDIEDKNSREDCTNLGELFSYAFDKFKDAPFGFDFTPNLMFKQGKPFAEFKMRKIGGAWWGGCNDPQNFKTTQSHEDDNIRTAKALHKHGGVGAINWLVATSAVGINKGGMQESGDRGTGADGRRAATQSACFSALETPPVNRYFKTTPEFIESMDFYSLRLRSIRDLRKLYPDTVETKWSTYLQVLPDVLATNSTLEDFF